MKKLVLILSVAGFTIALSSCKKETTCECQAYIIEDDGTRTENGAVTTRVVESKDADCSQFNEYDDTLVGNDREVKCEEKVFDD